MFPVLTTLALLTASANAVETAVPVPLQATLLVKVAAYDRTSLTLATPVIVVERHGDIDSERIASQMKLALEKNDKSASRVEIADFTDAAALATQCESVGAHLVYLATPLSEAETAALGVALSGKHVLTVSADPTSVAEGVVLAFDLVSGQTKILINLPQAKLQGVDFDTALLSIAKVYK